MNKESLLPHVGRWCRLVVTSDRGDFSWSGVLELLDGRSASYRSKDGTLTTVLLSDHKSLTSEEVKNGR